MRLFLLSILAIGSVHSLSIGYPYQSALLAYSPGRGEFPVQSTEVQGYLRYFDNNGVEHLLSYIHPEPTLGVRHVGGTSNPVLRSYNIDLATYPKAIEEHFRVWITVQYKALRDEIYALKSQGKEPSADMLIRLQPLEKIYQTADFSTIADLPAVKRLIDEHSSIYKVKTDILRQPIGETMTYTTSANVPLVPAGETPEQKLAHEKHLRIYNEQVARLRLLEAQREDTVKTVSNEAQFGETKIVEQQPINRLAGQTEGITEVERATQEHMRLWNEAKLRAEKFNYQQEDIPKESGLKTNEPTANKQVIFETVQHFQSVVQEPVEILKARAEHLRLVNEATLRVQTANAAENSPHVQNIIPVEQQPNFQFKTSAPVEQHQVQHHSVVDTPEVMRARDEHLRLVDEARLRAESVEQEELKHKQFVHVPLLTTSVHTHAPTLPKAAQAGPIADTSEVVRAPEEHLRLFNEAQQKVQAIEQSQNVHYAQPQVVETPEVIKARQEHLRIFNAIKSHVEQEQAKMTEIKAFGIELKSHKSDQNSEKISEQERLNEEDVRLELERIREATRLQDEQKQLELQQLREAERFDEEQRQMEAEIKRLRREEEQRLELEKLIESRRLNAEQEQAQQIIITDEFKPTDGETQQPLFFSNRFLTDSTGESQTIQQQLAQQQPTLQQMYVNNPFLKSPTIEGQTLQQQLQQATMSLAVQPQPTIPIHSKAIEEHFRAWITVQYKALRDQIYALKAQGKEPSADILIKLQSLEKIYQTADFSTIAELPEVKSLINEHSRIYKVKTEFLPQPIGEVKTYTTSTNMPLVPAGETPEQKLAREEHLRIYNEQIASQGLLEAQFGQTKITEQQPINLLAGQADGVTEVERATQEHLHLWNEAKLRAEKANYQQESIAKELKTSEPTANKQVISETVQNLKSVVQEPAEILKAREEHLRLVNEATLRVQNANAVIPVEQQPNFQLRTSAPVAQHQVQHNSVMDTPEVMRARDEHLRLVHEARLRAEGVEQERLKHKQFVHEPLLTTSVYTHVPALPQAAQAGPIADTSEVVRAREEHLRLVNEAQQKVQVIEKPQTVHYAQPQVVETPEVIKARQEHLRIFDAIKSHVEQEQAKMTEIKAYGIELKSHKNDEDSEKIKEQERLNEEAGRLELERIREATRLQDEQKQLELEQLREAERLSAEQRQMEAEIKRLQLEEQQRLELEMLIESRRLNAEQEQAPQIIITEEFKPTYGGTQQPLFFSNRFLTDSTGEGQTMQQQLAQQQPALQQMYVNNPFLKSPTIEGQTLQQQLQQATMSLAAQPQQQPTITTEIFPSESRKIQSSQNSIGTKQQHIKDDFIKHQTVNHAGHQPADTAAVLIHLEKARQEHFRAHDQALEQLRLAREHRLSLKDCN